MGSITTRLNEDEFEVIESPEQIQAKTKNVSKKVTSKVKAQLDLRGCVMKKQNWNWIIILTKLYLQI